jgi:hypothetical protein
VSENDRPDPDATEMVDLGDADVSAVEFPPSAPATPGGRDRSVPPPLPPEVRASAPPPSYLSAPPPPPRSNKFYALLIVGFVAVGVIVGLAVALGTRGEKKRVSVTTSASPSAAAAGSVMTLPTIDMNDDEADGGK